MSVPGEPPFSKEGDRNPHTGLVPTRRGNSSCCKKPNQQVALPVKAGLAGLRLWGQVIRVKPWPCRLVAVWLWESHSLALCLTFLVCKTGIRTVPTHRITAMIKSLNTWETLRTLLGVE